MLFYIGLSPWISVQGLLHEYFFFAGAAPGSDPWRMWPFEVSGMETPYLVLATKALFLLLILAAVSLLLRWLFGPGGPLREPWMNEKAQREESEEKDEGNNEL